MKSPGQALLWEIWRITRVESAWKLAFGVVGGLAVLALFAAIAPAGDAKRHEDIMDNGAAFAMFLLVLPHLIAWVALAKLTGGKPGFPFHLHYPRPVRTAVIVGLPMVYLTALSSAIYLVSALLMRFVTGYAFPLLPVAAWIAALTVLYVAVTWSTRNMTVQVLVMVFVTMQGLWLAIRRLTAVEIPDTYDWPPRLWPTLFDFPRSDYALIALIGLACFGIAVAMVSRQRRGDGLAVITSPPGSGFWGWLINLFRLPCPTSSPTRAQIWLDLKSNGLPLLTIGVALSIVILLLSAAGGPIDAAYQEEIRASLSCANADCFYARPMPVLVAPISVLVLLVLGGNAFGIGRKPGRTYVSAFQATQAYGTAQLATIKLLVKSACLLAALLAVGVSVWASIPLLGDPVFVQMWNLPLSSRLLAINGAVAAWTAYQQLALVVVAVGGVVVWVTAFAVIRALWLRYPRRGNIAALLVLFSGLAFALLPLAERNGMLPAFLVDAIFTATKWIALAAMVFTTAYVFWRGFAERVLTTRYAVGSILLSTALAAAWLTLLPAAGVQFAVSVLLLALMAGVLAPWSLNRVRHT